MKNFLKFKTGENSPDLRKFGEEYYLREAKLWRPFRIGGIASIGLALPFSMGSIFNAYWLYGEGNYLFVVRKGLTTIFCTHNSGLYRGVYYLNKQTEVQNIRTCACDVSNMYSSCTLMGV